MKTTWITAAGALVLLIGCGGGGDIVETNYTFGEPTSQAVLKPKKDGVGYQTLSGDPIVAVDGGITTESQLPYGGGNSGIREAQDEAAPTGF